MQKKEQRIVITGGSGFIGSIITDKIFESEIYEPIVIDRNKPKNNKIEFFCIDFNDKLALKKIIEKNDIVVHLACTTFPSNSESERVKDIQENVIGTLNLLDVCVEKKIKKFIFFSSGGTVYGDGKNEPFTEEDLTNPIGSHGVMKLMIEKYIQVYHNLYGLNYFILRLGNPYGNYSVEGRLQGVIDVMIDKAIKNETITILGKGEVVRDFFSIKDFADFFVSKILNEKRNDLINIGSGKGFFVTDVLKIIEKSIKHKLSVNYEKSRSFDVSYNVLNIDKAKKEYGWNPKTDLCGYIKNRL